MSITNMLSVANVTDQKREERTRKMSVIQIHIYVIQTNWFEVASRDVTHSLFPDDATDNRDDINWIFGSRNWKTVQSLIILEANVQMYWRRF